MSERTPEAHEREVAAIAARVREQVARGEPHSVSKGGVSHFVPLPGELRFRCRPIDVSSLDRILEIDAASRRCVCEPGVSFGRLVRATIPFGLVPAVVPELEGISLGGAVAGCSVESISYRRGGFHDSCLEYEVVTGLGEVLTVSRENEPLLFGMMYGSYGTLAILTKITFELGGIKTLIGRNHYSRERFWSIYNKPNVDAAKARLDPRGVFPGLYENFHKVG